MRLPFVSRRRFDDLAAQHQYTVRCLAKASEDHDAFRVVVPCLARELDACKEVVALHIVSAGHSSTVVHDVKRFAESLREALAANDVDLRLELARLEGADL